MSKKVSARDALIEASERLFASRSYADVGTREIAEEAQVNLAAIQYHFGSKSSLFIHTMRALMHRTVAAELARTFPVAPDSRREGAYQLCRYVALFLSENLESEHPQSCRIIYREVFGGIAGDTELFESVLALIKEEYIQPSYLVLFRILRALRPEFDEDELRLTSQSIIGQCLFYSMHRPFIERLRGIQICPEYLEGIARHIADFSLTALGVEREITDAALAECKVIKHDELRN